MTLFADAHLEFAAWAIVDPVPQDRHECGWRC